MLLPFLGPAQGAEQRIFGPTQYTRSAGPPTQFQETIAVPATLAAPFRLHIQNGNPDGSNRISSATITLNGTQIAGPSDFSQQVAAFDRTVTLQANNTLQVRLTSPPGGFLVLTLYGTFPPPALTKLEPPTLPITPGGTGALTATISAAQPTDTTITLSSSSTSVATVPATATVPAGQLSVGIPVTGVSPGTAAITATLNESTLQSTVTVQPTGPTLTSLTPATLQVTQGASGILTVTISAAQATDTVVALTSSNATIVGLPGDTITVPAGQASQSFAVFGNSPGQATITASLNGITAQSQVTVVIPLPTVVSLLPPVLPLTEGSTGSLTVTLSASQPTDTDVFLSRSDPTIVGLPGDRVTVPAHTLFVAFPVTGLTRGTATVTASLNGTTATAAITVQPPPPTIQGLTCPATLTVGATGLCTVTLNATQLTETLVPLGGSNPGVLSVPASVTVPANTLTAQFAVTALAQGSATITAGPLNGTSQSAAVQVLPPPPTIVSLTPGSATLFVGATASLTLTINAAQLTDTAIPLASSPTGIISVPATVTVPAGSLSVSVTVTGLTPGSATLTAGPLNGTQAQSTIAVNQLPPTVTTLTPPSFSLPKGKAGTLTVTIAPSQPEATVVPLSSSDPLSLEVPASITVPAGATSAPFPVIARTEGSATVTAGPLNGTSQQATVTVTPPELVTLVITPPAPSIPKGQSQQFTATGTYTDATTQDLTNTATWASSDETVATITSPGGLATGLSPGQATITATVGSLSATASLTVTPPILDHLTLSPVNPSRNVGGTLQFEATGILTDGTPQPLPVQLTWTSSDPAVASIAAAGLATALATALTPGSTTITAAHPDGFTVSTTLTVTLAPPTLASFSPSAGKVGTSVTLTGTNFATVTSVSFNGIAASGFTVNSFTAITVPVPSGATTGPISVTTSAGTATSTGHFLVLPTQDVTLTVEPTTVTAIAGTSVSLKVSTVTTGGFTGLTTLGTGTLPTGVTATFNPPTLGPNASGLLTLSTSGSTPSSSTIEVRGTATIEGTVTTRTATATLNVQAAGQTVLVGQVLNENERPIPGVSIKLGGSTITTLGTTDAAGNFLVTLSVAGPQVFLIDGSTASTATLSFPTIPITVSIQAGTVNGVGFVPHLHSQPTAKLIPITPGQETILTDPDLPGFKMTIPSGVSIIGWDGQPNTQVSVKAIPIDRSPLPPSPPGQTSRVVYLFYFGKMGGGLPTGNVPVDTPNDVDGLPGEKVDLYYFNEAPDGSAPNQWEKYGTGTISSDGSRIVTDINPTTGQPYGIPRFCCGGRRNVPQPPPPRPGGGPPGGAGDAGQSAGEPVDTATGFFYLTKTDLVLPGITHLVVTRTYRTALTNTGPFGLGTSWEYDRFLLPPPNGSPDALLLFTPGNRQDLFARQSDGAFINTTSPTLRGAVVTVADGLRSLRFKDGTTWRFRTSDGLLVSQSDRNGNTLTIFRDSQGRVTSLVEPRGRALTFSYAGTNLRIDRISDPLGREVRYSYDAQGRLETVTDPAGGITRYTYDPAHRLLTITDPRGITFLTNEYDGSGRVVKQTQADGGVWSFAYTTTGNFISQTTVTDPRGNATTYRFNSAGYLISQTDALSQTTTFNRQPATNILLSTTDPLGRVSRFEYDASGNVTKITDLQGNLRTFTYDPVFNKVTSIKDPLGNVTTFEYDATGNLIKISDPLTNTTTITHNASGQPISRTDPLGNTTTFTYNDHGNLVGITDPLGNTTQRSYDLVSRLIAQTDALGRTTRFSYDALNRLVSLVDALNGVTAFTYDPNGNLLTVTDARGNTITHEYDPMDRLSRRIDPLGKAETFTHDGNGNLVTTTDRKGQITAFTYDTLDRRVKSEFADGAVATFTYDSGGRLTQADDTADPHRPITLAYDSLDRLLAETTPLGTVGYQYDPLGRRTQMTVSGQAPVTYSYDAASHLRTITQAPLNPVDIQYDALGRRTLLSLPNGVSTEYIYDLGSRLSALVYRNALGPLGDLTYQYDAAGNRIGVGGSFARTLPPDPVSTAAHDVASRQLSFGDKTMTYDANSNLTSITELSGTQTFTWDARNRLTALSDPSLNATFSYDAFGRRVTKQINGQVIQFLYDGVDIVQQFDPLGTTAYVRSLNIDEALSFINRDGTYFSIYDPLGSTLAITDSAGTPAVQYTYGPFGTTLSTNPAFPNPFQFTSRENDGLAVLYYYRARYYHPVLGRFLSEDPLGLTGGDINLYAYVSNNPTTYLDPFGLLRFFGPRGGMRLPHPWQRLFPGQRYLEPRSPLRPSQDPPLLQPKPGTPAPNPLPYIPQLRNPKQPAFPDVPPCPVEPCIGPLPGAPPVIPNDPPPSPPVPGPREKPPGSPAGPPIPPEWEECYRLRICA